MDAAKAAEIASLVEKCLKSRELKTIGQSPEANPVFVMYRLDDLLNELEILAKQSSFCSAAEALSRGCTWRDYDKGWLK